MKINITYTLLTLISFSLFSCNSSKKIESLKPNPSNNAPVVYKSNTSFIALPLEISLKEIENQLNKNVNGLIYQDSILEDDKTQMKIWKTESIALSESNGMITAKLPLKIWAKYKYGTEFLGLNDTKEFQLNGIITLESKANLNNWKLLTTSKIKDFVWNESPTVTVAGKLVPITYLINPALTLFKSKIAKKIDEAIYTSCDFKPHILNVLSKLSDPFLTSETYETWFKLIPNELYVTDVKVSQKKINLKMGLKCQMQTMVGQKPKNTFDETKIALKPVQTFAEESSFAIAAVSTYESASKVITKNFQGQEFGSGKKKITIQKVDLWYKDKKIIIALETTGAINGIIYLSGIPNYNGVLKEIYFEQMDFVLDTKNVLLKSANWLLHGTILKKIQENCRYPIKENLDEAKKNINPYLQNYSPMKGIFINGSTSDFEFEKVELTDKAIIAFINATGKITVKIDGMD